MRPAWSLTRCWQPTAQRQRRCGPREAGALRLNLVSVVAASQGEARVAEDHSGVRVLTAAVDDGRDADAYIVPQLGDFGDRLFAT